MFKALLRVQFSLLLNSFAAGSRKKGAKAGFAAAMLIAALAIAMMMALTFDAVARPFYEAGIGWFYFALFVLVAFFLMLLGSIFTAKSQLFEAKDNALLLAMPIPPRQILFSRLTSLILLNGFFELTVALPAAVCWARQCPVTPLGAVSFLLICLCLPLMVTALSALLGWLISLATRRIRNKTLLTTVFSLAFLAVYFLWYGRLIGAINNLAASGPDLAERAAGALPLLLPGRAIAEGRLPDLLLSLAGMLLPFLLACWLLSATLLRTLTASHSAAKAVYREKTAKAASAAAALYRRELAKLLSSAGYLMNCAFGVFVMIALSAVLLIKWDAIESVLTTLGFGASMTGALCTAALCFISTMNTISAPSVSLEGKSLWIAQSLPVPTWDILLAKLRLHLSLAVPAVLLPALVLLWLLRPALPETAMLLLVPPLFNLFLGQLGLAANLKFPNLSWNTETAAVKNSASVMVVIFGGWVIAALPVILLVAVPSLPPLSVTLLFTALVLALNALLYVFLKCRGTQIYQSL